jgi:hypothetical protein
MSPRPRDAAAAEAAQRERTDAASPPDDQAGREPDAARPRRISVGKLVTVVGGGAAALAAVTTVITWAQKQFDGSSPVADAQITDQRVVSMHDRVIDYLRDTNQPTTGLTAAQKRQEGIRATLRVRFQGRRGERLPLRWSLRPADGTRLRGRTYNQRPIVFTVEHQSDARTVPIWIPYPPHAGRYIVDFRVFDPHGKPLDEEQTRVFVVRDVPRLE